MKLYTEKQLRDALYERGVEIWYREVDEDQKLEHRSSVRIKNILDNPAVDTEKLNKYDCFVPDVLPSGIPARGVDRTDSRIVDAYKVSDIEGRV